MALSFNKLKNNSVHADNNCLLNVSEIKSVYVLRVKNTPFQKEQLQQTNPEPSRYSQLTVTTAWAEEAVIDRPGLEKQLSHCDKHRKLQNPSNVQNAALSFENEDIFF